MAVTELTVIEQADKLYMAEIEKPCTTEQDVEELNEYLKKVKRCKTELTEDRDRERRPHKVEYDAVNTKYNKYIKNMEHTEKLLKSQVRDFLVAQEKKAEEARKKAEADARKKKKVTGVDEAPPPTPDAKTVSGTHTVKRLQVSVMAPSKVPDEIFRKIAKIDGPMLNAYIKAQAQETGKEQHKIKIPGIKIELVTDIRTRA